MRCFHWGFSSASKLRERKKKKTGWILNFRENSRSSWMWILITLEKKTEIIQTTTRETINLDHIRKWMKAKNKNKNKTGRILDYLDFDESKQNTKFSRIQNWINIKEKKTGGYYFGSLLTKVLKNGTKNVWNWILKKKESRS